MWETHIGRCLKGEAFFYDLSYTSLTTSTIKTIAKLLCTDKDTIKINLMNVYKQTGSVDCGLFAIASLTLLALGGDPTNVVFNQEEMRSHFLQQYESQHIQPFPILKHRRPRTRVAKIEMCMVYCYCQLLDDEETVVCCDRCDSWYHKHCVDGEVKDGDAWYCNSCKM